MKNRNNTIANYKLRNTDYQDTYYILYFVTALNILILKSTVYGIPSIKLNYFGFRTKNMKMLYYIIIYSRLYYNIK